MLTPEEYLAAMNRIAETGETPPLSEFRDLAAYDSNTIWRLGPGHAAGLLDQAMDELDEVTGKFTELQRAYQESLARLNALSIQLEDTK